MTAYDEVAPLAHGLMTALAIGNTRTIELGGFSPSGQVWLKAEYENPFGSVKDRTAAYLVAWAVVTAGRNVRVVESTSGNLGITLPRVCAEAGLPRPLIVVDVTMPAIKLAAIEREEAEVILVSQSRPGMDLRETRIAVAEELGQRNGYLWVNQYGNEVGVAAHAETTGPELTRALPELDTVVASISTGGTACGIAMYLSRHCPAARVVAVEPEGSTIFGGESRPFMTAGAGMHGPSEIVQRHGALLGGFAKVPDELAAIECAFVKDRHGIAVGLTSGAALVCARIVCVNGVKLIVVAPDGEDHYTDELSCLRLESLSRGSSLPEVTITMTR